MSDSAIVAVSAQDEGLLAQVDALLAAQGLRREAHLDRIYAVLDGTGRVVATGSCFGQTLRCFAVDPSCQGEGLLGPLVSCLTEFQVNRGITHLFVYTKTDTAHFFKSLGYYEIAQVDGAVSFLENRRDGFSRYLEALKKTALPGRAGAVVMNANPFTLGHRYLVQTAAAACEGLHLFVLSQDASLVPFDVRMRLVRQGTADIPGVVLHPSGPYLISHATFPSYFLKDSRQVIQAHARLDAALFAQLAQALGVCVRFAGEEPTSTVTAQYNACMAQVLPRCGIACRIIPRKTAAGAVISASTVRTALRDGDWDTLRAMLPETSLAYFRSQEAAGVLAAIRRADTLVHY